LKCDIDIDWDWDWDSDLVYSFAFPLQTELKAEHAAVLKAKEKKERESHLNSVNALERERQKHERTLAIASKQHDTDMDNVRRRSKREWQNVCEKLQELLGQQQTQCVRLQLQRARDEDKAKAREDALRRELSEMHVAVGVSTSSPLLTDLFYFMICLLCVVFGLGPARWQPAGSPNWNIIGRRQIIK
jgi:hypothetical protein